MSAVLWLAGLCSAFSCRSACSDILRIAARCCRVCSSTQRHPPKSRLRRIPRQPQFPRQPQLLHPPQLLRPPQFRRRSPAVASAPARVTGPGANHRIRAVTTASGHVTGADCNRRRHLATTAWRAVIRRRSNRQRNSLAVIMAPARATGADSLRQRLASATAARVNRPRCNRHSRSLAVVTASGRVIGPGRLPFPPPATARIAADPIQLRRVGNTARATRPTFRGPRDIGGHASARTSGDHGSSRISRGRLLSVSLDP
jgi:hypothetical protein